jgi:hypothetical protein
VQDMTLRSLAESDTCGLYEIAASESPGYVWGTHIVKDLRALSELEGVVYEPEVIFFC